MDDLEHLSAAERSHLLRALETASGVRHRGELFLWSQGPLHALLPHGVLVCMLLDASHGVRQHDCLHAVPLDPLVAAQLGDPRQGVLARVVQSVRQLGTCSLATAAPGDAVGVDLRSVAADLQGLGLGHGLVHSTGPMPDSAGFLVLMLGTPAVAPAHQTMLLQALAPQLLLGFLRSLVFGQSVESGAPAEPVRDLGLTERQLEILHWVKLGKTNHETAQILSVSELTVKNHLQRAFRKLNVHNRAQAVARLMAAHLE